MNPDDVRRQWADRSGEFSPEYYAYYGPNETSDVLLRTLDRFVDRSAPVLELGCSSGRHLAHLHDHGFENPVGIELNADAFDVMADAYPALASAGEFYPDAVENVVDDFGDDRFAAVYSVETLQHIHPDAAWVFDELSRITGDLLVTVENEASDDDTDADRDHDRDCTDSSIREVSYVNDEFPLYHRDWNEVFTDRGFVEVDAKSVRRDTVRAFRTTDGPSTE